MTTPPPSTGKSAAPAPLKPDEEDLDELDDLLDQFTPAPSSVPPPASKPTPPSGSAPASAPKDAPAPDPFSEDFEATLMREMEAMLKAETGNETGDSANDFATAWQNFLIKELEGTSEKPNAGDSSKSPGAGTSSGATADSDTNPDAAFQRTIRQAMDKLKSSDESARASESALGADAETLAQLLKQLNESGGDGGDDGLQDMIKNMMGELMSKEILYEPLAEMRDKFPGYFAERPNLPEDDLKRYKAQEALVKKIVTIYDKPNYSDENKEMKEEVLKLMNEMQELGSPPTEIMGEVPPGVDFGSPDGIAKLLDSDGCTIA